MSQCQVISPLKSSYNAVNIKINNPRANVTDNRMADDGELNAVSLEINNPEIRQKSMYSYPVYDAIVKADMADITLVRIMIVIILCLHMILMVRVKKENLPVKDL